MIQESTSSDEALSKRGLRFYVLCGNVSYNKGDRVNLLAQLHLLRKRFPSCEVTLNSLCPEQDEKWLDASFVRTKFPISLEQMTALNAADVVIWGGGALIADNACRTLVPYWTGIIAVTRLLLRKPIMAWSHGVVLETRLGRVFASLAYRLVDVITVRDASSYRAVSGLKWMHKPIFQTADSAVCAPLLRADVGYRLLKSSGVPVDSCRIIGISPTYWHLYHRNTDLVPFIFSANRKQGRAGQEIQRLNEGLCSLVNKLLDEDGVHVLLMPRYAQKPWRDVEFLRSVEHLVSDPSRVTVLSGDLLGPSEYLSLFQCLSFHISIALHDAICATLAELPSIHLFYEEKGGDFFRAIGGEDRLLHWSALCHERGVEQIFDLYQWTRENWPTLKGKALAGLEDLKERTLQNLDILESLLRG